MEWHIKFKIATLTFKVLESGLPPYLSQQLLPYAPTRGLRSSSSKLLQVPRTNLRFGSHSFCVSALTIRNSVSHNVRSWESLTTFRKHRKNTLLSIGILCRPQRPTTQRLRFNFLILALYKSTYLLTYLFAVINIMWNQFDGYRSILKKFIFYVYSSIWKFQL